MKKTLIALAAACILMACGNGKKANQQAADSTAVTAVEEQIVPDVPKDTFVFENDISKFDHGTGVLTVKGVHYDMAYVTCGTFTMGAAADDADAREDERPSHKVTITHDYYIGKTEVTVGFWKAVMGSNPPGNLELPDNCPVQNVSWEQCQEFAGALFHLQQCGELEDWNLPTEAEWEFAARGGNKSKGYKYSGSNNLDDVAWYTKNFYNHDEDAFQGDYPQVALKKPNELGIYDMSGSVDEWCLDQYGAYTDEAQEDPRFLDLEAADICVLRGGNHLSEAGSCRVTARSSRMATEESNPLTGFRLVYRYYRQDDCEDEW